MLSHEPVVTVIIPSYNSAATLRRAVASALGQTLRELEVIVVDDGSRDQSLALARTLTDTDSRMRLIALPENKGKPYAMNLATATAAGAWIAVLDADDWYEPNRLEILVAAAERHDVPLVADNQYFHDAGAGITVGMAFPSDTGDVPITRSSFIAASDPYANFNYGMLKPVIRTDFIRNTSLAYRENARLSEDFLYMVEFLSENGTGLLVSQPLYHWTQSFGSVSRTWTNTGSGAWRYDFLSALDANTEVIHRMRTRHETELLNLLLAREKAFKNLHHMSELSRSRSAGAGLPKILGMVAQHPSVWPLLTRRALHAARILKRI